ncbi:kinase-like domain-containing protein [Cristinia sonorae]|uniref:cAMP-dependent protein kinase n=1 Tax=Cristinia sonorae TaxID=1940300 RepID=A0A8K0UL33_9AGAR|nr:kinase-like domain-containing protein [Cristinia sonorae]
MPVTRATASNAAKKPYQRLVRQKSDAAIEEFFGPEPYSKTLGATSLARRTDRRSYRCATVPEKDTEEDVRPEPLDLEDLRAISLIGHGGVAQAVAVKVKRENSSHCLERKGSVLAMKLTSNRSTRDLERGKVHDKDRTEERQAERRAHWTLPWNPFVAGLLDVYYDDVNTYQLQEFAQCGTLADLIRSRGALPPDWIQFYLSNIVIGLEFIHSHGVMHRDIKPANIFISRTGYLMIGDFGSAAHVHECTSWQRIGTRLYTPPEVNLRGPMAAAIFDMDFDKRVATDWWGVAVTLYEMATNNVRVEDDTAIYNSLQSGTAPIPANVDRVLRNLITRMLNPDLRRRYGAHLMHCVDPASGAQVLRNLDIRSHKFMLDFPWDDAARRTLLSPCISAVVPDFARGWNHSVGMMSQADMPSLLIEEQPAHRSYDLRCVTGDDSDTEEDLLPE